MIIITITVILMVINSDVIIKDNDGDDKKNASNKDKTYYKIKWKSRPYVDDHS